MIDEEVIAKDVTLLELRKICSSHKAFQETTRLELLAGKYDIRIIFCPKFHCELNPIEGLWCYMKNYIRRNTDQTFNKMKELIFVSAQTFEDKKVNLRLWNRFWRTILIYKQGNSYQQVLTSLFGPKVKDTPSSHLRVSNTCLQVT